ncbi:MAG: phosphatase PAP2 family protein [Bacteroidota bacterium]
MISLIEKWDVELFLWLNSQNNPFFDTIMWYISGKYIWIPLYLFIIYMLVRKMKVRAIYAVLAVILVVALADLASVHLLKNLVQRYRPSHNTVFADIVHIVNNYRGGLYGFVSSHAANTFGMAILTSLLMRNRMYTILILIWASVVSYSRIYLGVHYPLDIAGGMITGTLLAFIVFIVYKKLNFTYIDGKHK